MAGTIKERGIRLPHDVYGDWPIGHTTMAPAGVYSGEQLRVNQHGAVAVIASNGKLLGVKPHEFEVLSAAPSEGGA